jgi:hypothetical protein
LEEKITFFREGAESAVSLVASPLSAVKLYKAPLSPIKQFGGKKRLFIFYELGGSPANQPKSTPSGQKPNQNQAEPNQKMNPRLLKFLNTGTNAPKAKAARKSWCSGLNQIRLAFFDLWLN